MIVSNVFYGSEKSNYKDVTNIVIEKCRVNEEVSFSWELPSFYVGRNEIFGNPVPLTQKYVLLVYSDQRTFEIREGEPFTFVYSMFFPPVYREPP